MISKKLIGFKFSLCEMKVANYFSYCVNGGLLPGYFYIEDLAETYMESKD